MPTAGTSGSERRVPADQGDDRLVDVDDVVGCRAAQLAARLEDAVLGRTARFETAPLAPIPIVRPSGIR